jgi:hypothetical protein
VYSTPDDGQRNCPKHVEFYSKNKFDKLVHLVGFIIRIRIVPMYWKCNTTSSSCHKKSNGVISSCATSATVTTVLMGRKQELLKPSVE